MTISVLFDYSLPVVGLELCVVWIVVHTFLEPYFMPRIFGQAYLDMDVGARRSLTNHVISFGLKIICCVGAYSIMETFFIQTPLDQPISTKHSHHTITNGDILAFCYLTVPTIYIFEIIYRTNISVVSAIHHLAAIMINILGIVVIMSHQQTGYLAQVEFKLILIYGTFEMVFEIFPHLAVMLYRTMRDRSLFLYRLFLSTGLFIFAGTLSEQVAIFIFYRHVWHNLPVFYKVVGPILHLCFMAAQVHGGRVCIQIARKMKKEVGEAREKGKAPMSPVNDPLATTSASPEARCFDLERGCPRFNEGEEAELKGDSNCMSHSRESTLVTDKEEYMSDVGTKV